MVKTKLKPLLPSLREKKRYLAFEIISKSKIDDFKLVENAIFSSLHNLTGVIGLAKAGIIPMEDKWNPNLQMGIIKVSHLCVDELKSALALCKSINGSEVIFKSLKVTGVLNEAVRRLNA
ncbi:MAG TPA: Rpp14/Pop5 family protein [Candidatus Nanoarchaeia archaeon]|nr:Rpp14/Pop5 family protein [Candidatus Nanoarchaeia archaeon]